MATRRPARTGSRWLVPTVLLLVVAPIAVAVTTAVRGGGDGETGDGTVSRSFPRTGSSVVAAAGGASPLRIRSTPESYEITYRVTTAGTPNPATATEELRVQRPFLARVATTPPAGGPPSVRSTRLGALVIPTGSGARKLAVPPAMAGSDLRFDVALPSALAEGRVEEREQRRVAGRRCQVYRFGGTTSAGDLTTYAPDGPEWADACVDGEGLLLEELWHKDGRDLRHRVATEVVVGRPLDEDLFSLDGEVPLENKDGNGVFRRVAPDSRVEGPTVAITPPEGFEPLGRFAVQAPRLDPQGAAPIEQLAPPDSFDQIDVWRRGPDLLVLATTISADASSGDDEPKGAPVDLGPLGAGRLEVTLRGSTVTATRVDGRTPRVSGTLPPAELVALLRQSTMVEGTGLRFDDGA